MIDHAYYTSITTIRTVHDASLALETARAGVAAIVARLHGAEPTPDTSGVRARFRRAGLSTIAEGVERRSGLDLARLVATTRDARTCRARDELVYLIRESDPKRWSWPCMAAFFGRDHSSLLTAHRRHAARVARP